MARTSLDGPEGQVRGGLGRAFSGPIAPSGDTGSVGVRARDPIRERVWATRRALRWQAGYRLGPGVAKRRVGQAEVHLVGHGDQAQTPPE